MSLKIPEGPVTCAVKEFEAFPKIPRLNRDMVITEKIDGTNAGIYIDEKNNLYPASKNRWIDPENDNYGFARWVEKNKFDLVKLGPGMHWGEWWGQGIQRKYELDEKRFSLFNSGKWKNRYKPVTQVWPRIEIAEEYAPKCCHVVPVLYVGMFSTGIADHIRAQLRKTESAAAPGYDNPEGIVIYHVGAQGYFKATCYGDEKPKGSTE